MNQSICLHHSKDLSQFVPRFSFFLSRVPQAFLSLLSLLYYTPLMFLTYFCPFIFSLAASPLVAGLRPIIGPRLASTTKRTCAERTSAGTQGTVFYTFVARTEPIKPESNESESCRELPRVDVLALLWPGCR